MHTPSHPLALSCQDDLLGFGEADPAICLSPAFVAVLSQLTQFISSAADASLQKGAPAMILVPEELEQVRQKAVETARELGLSGPDAERLVNYLLG